MPHGKSLWVNLVKGLEFDPIIMQHLPRQGVKSAKFTS